MNPRAFAASLLAALRPLCAQQRAHMARQGRPLAVRLAEKRRAESQPGMVHVVYAKPSPPKPPAVSTTPEPPVELQSDTAPRAHTKLSRAQEGGSGSKPAGGNEHSPRKTKNAKPTQPRPVAEPTRPTAQARTAPHAATSRAQDGGANQQRKPQANNRHGGELPRQRRQNSAEKTVWAPQKHQPAETKPAQHKGGAITNGGVTTAQGQKKNPAPQPQQQKQQQQHQHQHQHQHQPHQPIKKKVKK